MGNCYNGDFSFGSGCLFTIIDQYNYLFMCINSFHWVFHRFLRVLSCPLVLTLIATQRNKQENLQKTDDGVIFNKFVNINKSLVKKKLYLKNAAKLEKYFLLLKNLSFFKKKYSRSRVNWYIFLKSAVLLQNNKCSNLNNKCSNFNFQLSVFNSSSARSCSKRFT